MDQEDAKAFSRSASDTEPERAASEYDARLKIVSPSFKPDNKWRFTECPHRATALRSSSRTEATLHDYELGNHIEAFNELDNLPPEHRASGRD